MMQPTGAASTSSSLLLPTTPTTIIVNNNKTNHILGNNSNSARINQQTPSSNAVGGINNNFGNMQVSNNNGFSETTIANVKQPYVHHFRIAKKKTTIEFKMVDANDIRKNMYGGNTMHNHHHGGRTTTSTSSQLNISSSQTTTTTNTFTVTFNNNTGNTNTNTNSNINQQPTTAKSPSTITTNETTLPSSSNPIQQPTHSNTSHNNHTQSSLLSTNDNTVVSSDPKQTKKQKASPAAFAISSKITKHSVSRRNSMLSSHSVDLLQNNSNFQQEVLHCTPTTANCPITTKKNHQTRRKSVASPSGSVPSHQHAEQHTNMSNNNNIWSSASSQTTSLNSSTTANAQPSTQSQQFSMTNHHSTHSCCPSSSNINEPTKTFAEMQCSCPPTLTTSYFVAGFTFGASSKQTSEAESPIPNSSHHHHHYHHPNSHSGHYHGHQDGLYGEAYYSSLTNEQRRYLTHGGRKTFATLPSIEEMTRYHELRRNSIDELTQNFAQSISTVETTANDRHHHHHPYERISEPSPHAVLNSENVKNTDQRFRRRQTYAFESDHFSAYDSQYDTNCLQSLKSFHFPSRNPQQSQNSLQHLPTHHQHSPSLNNVPSSSEHCLLPSINELMSKR
ncbi:hypothetical protein FDP41_006796 [Naegleria fowleri]|uniref:Uncharacterized protein n=1 Tax=Naegleria fowleri TaxID=5763 RepID=A0A6A5BHJ7_NAEFO|nr:uncharacterized protein FDP41_006796 [Naegleria fowleri]KAF0974186.1 hypothetical protein FDP41_006796 [Naegleria fowleri]